MQRLMLMPNGSPIHIQHIEKIQIKKRISTTAEKYQDTAKKILTMSMADEVVSSFLRTPLKETTKEILGNKQVNTFHKNVS